MWIQVLWIQNLWIQILWIQNLWIQMGCGPIDLITDLSSEFLLGTEIAHYKEENESLVTNI